MASYKKYRRNQNKKTKTSFTRDDKRYVNNQTHDYYLFDQDNIYNKLILKDSYEFFITLDSGTGPAPANYAIPNLRLYYPYDTEENSTDAETLSQFYDFQIEMWDEDASSSYVLKSIQAYLGMDWEELISNALTKSPAPIDMTMIMTVPNTDYRTRGVISTIPIPEHILDDTLLCLNCYTYIFYKSK